MTNKSSTTTITTTATGRKRNDRHIFDRSFIINKEERTLLFHSFVPVHSFLPLFIVNFGPFSSNNKKFLIYPFFSSFAEESPLGGGT
jgi:hypothetical protein